MNKTVGSIVIYNPNLDVLKTTIRTFLASSPGSPVYIWDNSQEDKVSEDLKKSFPGMVIYFKSPGNLGYGRGHNEVFKKIEGAFDYFCILNPDLEIPEDTIAKVSDFMTANPSVGLVSCMIKGTDGVIHKVHKLMPSFKEYLSSLAARFLKLPEPPVKTIDLAAQSQPFRLPIISGCFMVFTKEHYAELGGFDDNFFLYFEDYDLSLRSYLAGKSIILPSVYIIHRWSRESRRNWKLLLTHIQSGLRFYWKWGFTSRFADGVNQKISAPSK